jgi:hypothetical protein
LHQGENVRQAALAFCARLGIEDQHIKMVVDYVTDEYEKTAAPYGLGMSLY